MCSNYYVLQCRPCVDKCPWKRLDHSALGLVLSEELRQNGTAGPGKFPYKPLPISTSVEAPWSRTDGWSRQHTVWTGRLKSRFNIMSHLMTKPTKWHVRPAKTQISLGIHPVWSESSLCALWVAKDPSFLHADSEDSDQTGRMPRLIWVFTGRTCHFVGFVTMRL